VHSLTGESSAGGPFTRRLRSPVLHNIRHTAGAGGTLPIVFQAVLMGMAVLLAGTMPRNFLFAANLRLYPNLPWAVPLTALYIWFFWSYLNGSGPPDSTSHQRRTSLRASSLSGATWAWALIAGGLGIVALVLALQIVNRLILLPPQTLPDLARVPGTTVIALLLMAAPVAGIVEEAAFRGYMQGPIERQHGLVVAILITGTMFAVAHLDFTPILWPYYVAVAAIYGTVTSITRSILPAIVLHTSGNLYSNFDLWRHGQAEWQAGSEPTTLIWQNGPDASFWMTSASLLVVGAVMSWAFVRLKSSVRVDPS
jgi:membrane protease YdiL (CAAX protease family)